MILQDLFLWSKNRAVLTLSAVRVEGLMHVCLFCLSLSFLDIFVETGGGSGTVLGSAWTTQRF